MVYLTRECDGDIEVRCHAQLETRGVLVDRWLEMEVGYSESKYLCGRLIVPIINEGKLVNFIARAVYEDMHPKELTGSRKDGWTPRSETLYGYDELEEGCSVVLTEGVWDAEAVRRIGWRAAATFGAHLSNYQVGMLARVRPNKILIAYDGDEAGRAGARVAVNKLRARLRRVPVAPVGLPEGLDPGNMGRENLSLHLQRIVAP